MEIEHAAYGNLGSFRQIRGDIDLIFATLEKRQEVLQRIHTHPRAVGAALACGSFPNGWGFDQFLVGGQLTHLVENTGIGCHDKFAIGHLDNGLNKGRC